MNPTSFITGLFESILGHALSNRVRKQFSQTDNDFQKTINQALASKGEISSKKYAEVLLSQIETMSQQKLLSFFDHLVENMEIDTEALVKNATEFSKNTTPDNLTKVRLASDSSRLELFRRLATANQGIIRLVRFRERLLALIVKNKRYRKLDIDLQYLFREWFNKGFLVLRPINWATSANILEKIIKYEAVHEIKSWKELRERLDPADRRCFAFFHPVMEDEPLIFVEVALMQSIPTKITDVLNLDRNEIDPNIADTAVFYSISNCQRGLQGISFGNFLIKTVVQNLKIEFKNIKNFVTLSPLPNLKKWLSLHKKESLDTKLDSVTAPSEKFLQKILAQYFLKSERNDKKPNDSVARFHLGNGASLHQININADLSPKGLSESFGVMVNYQYNLEDVENNHELYQNENEIVVSRRLSKWLSN